MQVLIRTRYRPDSYAELIGQQRESHCMVQLDEVDAEILVGSDWQVVIRKYGAGAEKRYVAVGSRALHREIMKARPGQVIDHINGDTMDNRRSNLRIATFAINAQNVRRPGVSNTTGFLGVDYVPYKNVRAPYRAQIKLSGKKFQIGMFETPEEAHQAYVEAKRRMHPGCTL
jgi:hypothetical protein